MPVTILQDLTVVECATFVTGPYAAALLGNLGARVIKIESPPDGDPYRYFAADPVFSFDLAHPAAGTLRFVGGPVRFENLASEKSAPPPLLGEQSGKILRDLGRSAAAIGDLQARGITRAAP